MRCLPPNVRCKLEVVCRGIMNERVGIDGYLVRGNILLRGLDLEECDLLCDDLHGEIHIHTQSMSDDHSNLP